MSKIPLIHGIFPAALTMFTEHGDVDEPATARHIEYLIRCGVHGIVACGSSGEFIAMTDEERLRVIQIIIDAARGRVPVYAGTGHYSTHFTIAMTKAAEKMGADGVIVILPYYQKPPKASMIEHYRLLRRETSLPIMLYNNPLYAGCVELSSNEIANLVEEGVIQSIKSTFESIVPVDDLLHLCGDRLRVFYGSFHAPMAALLQGAHGWISGFLNFLTQDCVSLYDACVAGDVARAREIWKILRPFKHLYTQQSLGPVNDLAIYRSGLELRGEYGGYSRAPFQPLTSRQRAQLKELMLREGVIR